MAEDKKKVTSKFQNVIQEYVERITLEDPVFKAKYESKDKNIEDCCTYILNQVKAAKQEGYCEEEIFGMALHYYDEEKIDVGKPISSGQVIVNYHVELSDEEKKKINDSLRGKARAKYEAQAIKEIKDEAAKGIVLSEDEVAKAKAEAVNKSIEEAKALLLTKKKAVKPTTEVKDAPAQGSLF